jgi:hypothetical protein
MVLLRGIALSLFFISLLGVCEAHGSLSENGGSFPLSRPPVVQPSIPDIDFSKIKHVCHPPLFKKPPFWSKYIVGFNLERPFGRATDDSIKRSPIYNIQYHTRGIEYQNRCNLKEKLQALERYIAKVERKANPPSRALVDQYRRHATELVSKPGVFGEMIDRCFKEISDKWRGCGGRYYKLATYMSRISRSLKVQIMSSTFYLSNSIAGPLWAGGMSSPDKRSIFAIASRFSSQNTFIGTSESFICWELGNIFAFNMNYIPKILSTEVGHRRPCDIIK